MSDRTDLESQSTRARRVAEHYLIGAGDSARLHKTVSLAARALDFPMGQINILDDRLMYTIGDHGSGGTVLPRDESMCHFVIDDDVPVLAVDDLRDHARYRDLPGVRSGFARSYLGVPLTSREATPVGTLCVVDSVPRHITEAQIELILEFGGIVQDQLDLFRRNAETPSTREASATLARALRVGEIEPWYQPIIDLRSGDRVGFEALARWRRPDGTVVGPDGFVAAAEDSDLVVDLDRAVIRAAVQDLARWRQCEPQLRVNVNLSTRHLELPDGASFVAQTVVEAGLDPSAVNVEITESRGLTDFDRATATVETLQTAGFRVILDDFANGWSGLDWLLGLGADGVKIDRSVTETLGTRVGDAVSRAVTSMSSELGMSTTLEGISDAAHLNAARAHGFHYGQGFLWSPPVPAVVVDATI